MNVLPKNLFICGCPRSGTTALWSLITAHTKCVIGVERYGNQFFHKDFISQNHFNKERFFQIKHGDTFYNNLEKFNPYYKTALQHFDEAMFVGDKIPLLYKYFGALHNNFPEATVLMIFRNIYDVANSYSVRASNKADKTWSSNKGVAAAVDDWTSSIAAFKNWSQKIRIIPIDYEKLFIEGSGVKLIFEQLQLEETPETTLHYTKLLTRSADLEKKRSRSMSSQEAKLISTRAPFGGYREIISQAI